MSRSRDPSLGPWAPLSKQKSPRRPGHKQKVAEGRETLLLPPVPALGGPPPTRDESVNAEMAAAAGPYPNPDVRATVCPKIPSL